MELEEVKTIQPPRKTLAMMYGVRTGKIFSNLSIVLTLISLTALFGFLFTTLIWTFGLILMIASLGTIFAIIPNYWQMLQSGSDFAISIANFIAKAWPYLTSIAIALAIGSIILLCFDKHERHIGRIVFSSIVAVAATIILIILATGGIK